MQRSPYCRPRVSPLDTDEGPKGESAPREASRPYSSYPVRKASMQLVPIRTEDRVALTYSIEYSLIQQLVGGGLIGARQSISMQSDSSSL